MTSQHTLGEAVDIVPDKRTPLDLFISIIQCNLEVDQCIYENGWVHVSLRDSRKNRRQYLCKPWA